MNVNIPKDWYRKTDTYFYLLPLVAGAWALLAAFVFYPASVQAWQDRKETYQETQKWMGQILALEPHRLAFKEEKGQSGEFDFTAEVDKFSKLFGIAPSNYTLNTRDVLKRAGKKSKSADVTLKTADIQTTAKFVSALLIRWPDLQCDQLTLQKLPSGKNDWKVKLRFTYYY